MYANHFIRLVMHTYWYYVRIPSQINELKLNIGWAFSPFAGISYIHSFGKYHNGLQFKFQQWYFLRLAFHWIGCDPKNERNKKEFPIIAIDVMQWTKCSTQKMHTIAIIKMRLQYWIFGLAYYKTCIFNSINLKMMLFPFFTCWKRMK